MGVCSNEADVIKLTGPDAGYYCISCWSIIKDIRKRLDKLLEVKA